MKNPKNSVKSVKAKTTSKETVLKGLDSVFQAIKAGVFLF